MSNHLTEALGYRRPERAARLFARIPGPPERRLSYGDLDALSGRFATALAALGVVPGDRVAVQVDKSVEAIALYLAAVRAGAVFLPLNTAYTAAEIDYFVGNAEPRLLVCTPSARETLAPVAASHGARIETMDAQGGGTLPGHLPGEADFADVPRGPDDLAAILYTSGTTGRSKGAMLSHANLASNAATLAALWRFTADDLLIHALPIFHTHGLFVATNVTLVAGGALIFHAKFDPEAVVEAMKSGATALMGVPTFYTRLLEHPALDRETAAAMRLFVSGSAPLLAETHDRWRERTGHAILERYGMTETNMNTSNPYDGERRAGTVGLALPDVEVIVADEEGRALAQGETGMVEVRGPNVFQGYWRMPEKTAEEKRDNGFFITGDLGRFDADGYLSIVGRAKDLVISGGYNVYPKEVETALDAVDGVVESAVIGLAHPDFGEGVAAVVVRDDPALTAEALVAAVAGDLARYKQPRKVFFVDSLPRNTMGKVQKKALRETYADAFQPEARTG